MTHIAQQILQIESTPCTRIVYSNNNKKNAYIIFLETAITNSIISYLTIVLGCSKLDVEYHISKYQCHLTFGSMCSMPEIPISILLHCVKEKYMWRICINVNVNPSQRVHLNLISLNFKSY